MRFLRSEPVTEPLPIADALKRTPYRDPNVMGGPDDDTEQQKALDIAARVGELLLRCGASTRDVEASVVAVAASAGLRRLEVDITNQSLLLQSPSTNGRQPLTMLRVVRSSTRDFSRLMAVHQFVERLVAGEHAVDEGAVRGVLAFEESGQIDRVVVAHERPERREIAPAQRLLDLDAERIDIVFHVRMMADPRGASRSPWCRRTWPCSTTPCTRWARSGSSPSI